MDDFAEFLEVITIALWKALTAIQEGLKLTW